MSAGKIIGGLAMMAGGYALSYYGLNVLFWAHSADEPKEDPIPLSHLFGFSSDIVGDPGEFMPPFKLGGDIPGAITDARGLLGGTATTGGYTAPEFTVHGQPGDGSDTGATGIGPSSGTGGTGTGAPPLPGSSNPTGTWQAPDIQIGNLGSAIGQAITGPIGSGTPVPKGWRPGVGFS